MSGDPALDDPCLAALRLPRQADTLTALFRSRVEAHGDRPFLLFRQRVRSWRETEAVVEHWARHMLSLGAAPGDRVAAILPNCDSHVVLLLACARAGLVFVPVNPNLSAADLEAALQGAAPALVIATDAASTVLAPICERLAPQPAMLWLDAADLDLPAIAESGAGPARTMTEPAPQAPLAIVFTSGTTGRPKGAIHVNETYVLAAEIAAFRMRLTREDRVLVILPLFHLNALFYSIGGAIVSGARLVIEERFHASGFWDVVNRFGITQVNMIAAVGNILLKRDRAEFPGNPTLRKVSAAPVSAAVAEALKEAFGIEHVVESYGMTEAPGIAQVDFHDRSHRSCLGRPISHPLSDAPISEIRLVDDAGADVARGRIGRVMIRARTMMKGYFRRPDLADRLSPEGWFLTEDLAREDADGYFYFCGRTSEIIRSRGENVAASEIEAALITHPGVNDAGCIGVPSELGEEDILAAVSPRPGARLDGMDLAAFCRRRLSPHKQPRYFLLMDDLPKTPTEKVARHKLKDIPDLLERAVKVEPDRAAPAGAGKQAGGIGPS